MNTAFEHQYTVCWRRRRRGELDYTPNQATAIARWCGRDPQASRRLPCGCVGTCDPYAHDTAWDWDGRADGPDFSDLSPREQKRYLEEHPDFAEEME